MTKKSRIILLKLKMENEIQPAFGFRFPPYDRHIEIKDRTSPYKSNHSSNAGLFQQLDLANKVL